MQQADGTRSLVRVSICLLLCTRALLGSAAAASGPISLLDVPYISQSEQLCGGAAAAMVLRYWGARDINAESFASLVDRGAAGIPTTALVDDLHRRGWMATAVRGDDGLLASEVGAGRPVLALIEERPHTYHYVVVVGLPSGEIVLHDPARAPFRVMKADEFDRRWDAAGRWMAIVLPPAGGSPPTPRAFVSSPGVTADACEELVADGVARARANDLPAAERALTSALGCPGPAPLRELAGVRVLQRRWSDAEDSARAALARDRHDAYAWQVLATSEFVQDRPLAALDAWNEVGQPTVDLVRIDGLVRTRFRPVERLIGIDMGTTLTRRDLLLARRRLSELPAATSSRVTYAPVGSGRVDVLATIGEKPVVPRDPLNLAVIGLSAATTRSATVTVASVTGAGESMDVTWRFWPQRPHIGVDFMSPAPFGGVWGVSGFAERQPFDDPRVPASQRQTATLRVTNWMSPMTRVTIHGGIDRWQGGIEAMGTAGGGVRLLSAGERLEATIDADAWVGRVRFGSMGARLRARSSTSRRGFVLMGTGGVAVVSHAAPMDLWPGGDTGLARSSLLRAHPIVIDGALRVSQLGRELAYGSAEAQHWWTPRVPLLRIGAAAFIDSARTAQRFGQLSRGDVDVGGGARFSIAGFPGVLRLDVAHGLRDGATAASIVYSVE